MKRLAITVIAIIVITSACRKSTAFHRAAEVAKVSQNLYMSVAVPFANRLGALARKFEDGGRDRAALTEAEWSVYAKLRKFQPTLEKYAQAHQAYVAALKVWQAQGPDSWTQMPPDINKFFEEMKAFIREAREVKDVL